MRRKSHKTTSGVKFDLGFETYVPDFLYDEKFWKLDHDFRYFEPIFCCACAETAIILLPVKFLTPNLKSPWAVSYSTTNFGGAYYKRVHEKKGHYKKSHISPICGKFPTQPNLTKISIWVGIADVINHTKLVTIGPGTTKLRRVEFWLHP